MSPRRPRLDVVMGAFGSGKTTLIRNALHARPTSAAIILNDLVSVGLEVEALRRVASSIIVVSGGCACCERRHDFRDALASLLDHGDRHGLPERIILECAGSARVEDVLDLVRRDVLAVNRIRLGRLIHTLDCQASLEAVDEDTLARIPRGIDLIVLTKTDLVPPAIGARIAAELAHRSPDVEVLEANGLDGADGADELARLWLSARPGGRLASALAAGRPSFGRAERGTPSARSAIEGPAGRDYELVDVAWSGEVDWARLGVWLSLFFAVHGSAVRRLKGEIVVGGRPVLLNAVGRTMYVPEVLETSAEVRDTASRILIVLDKGAVQPEALSRSLRCALGTGGEPPEAEYA